MGNDDRGFLFWTKSRAKTTEAGEDTQLTWTSNKLDGWCQPIRVKQHKRGRRKKEGGNNDKGFLFLNNTMGKNNRDGGNCILDLKLRWETGRHKLGEGDQIGNVGEHWTEWVKQSKKKRKISRKWATMTEDFFSEQSQGWTQQSRVKIHSWPRLQIN